MMLGDGAADLDDRRFLKSVGTDDGRADLAGDGDHRHGIHLGVGQAGDEIRSARTAGGHANAGFAGGARIAVRHEAAALLMAGQNRADLVFHLGERLVQRHAGAAGIGENGVDAMPNQALQPECRPRSSGRRCLSFRVIGHVVDRLLHLPWSKVKHRSNARRVRHATLFSSFQYRRNASKIKRYIARG